MVLKGEDPHGLGGVPRKWHFIVVKVETITAYMATVNAHIGSVDILALEKQLIISENV